MAKVAKGHTGIMALERSLDSLKTALASREDTAIVGALLVLEKDIAELVSDLDPGWRIRYGKE